MIDEFKNEIPRLNNTPKRPKFRKGGMEPRDPRKKSSDDSHACRANQVQNNPKKQVVYHRTKVNRAIPTGCNYRFYCRHDTPRRSSVASR